MIKDKTLNIISQPATEVYWGQGGHLCIKQSNIDGYEDTQIIFIKPNNIQELIDNLLIFKGQYDD